MSSSRTDEQKAVVANLHAKLQAGGKKQKKEKENKDTKSHHAKTQEHYLITPGQISSFQSKDNKGNTIYAIGYYGPISSAPGVKNIKGEMVPLSAFFKAMELEYDKSTASYFTFDKENIERARANLALDKSEGEIKVVERLKPVEKKTTSSDGQPKATRKRVPRELQAQRILSTDPAVFNAALTPANIREYLRTQSNYQGATYKVSKDALMKLQKYASPPAIEATLAIMDSYNTVYRKDENGVKQPYFKTVVKKDANGNPVYFPSVTTITSAMVDAAIVAVDGCEHWNHTKVADKGAKRMVFTGPEVEMGKTGKTGKFKYADRALPASKSNYLPVKYEGWSF